MTDQTPSQRILGQSRKNLERGRAVATGIGVFALVVQKSDSVLLRRRTEKDSLLGQDLSGKWEMTGGGVEIDHFTATPTNQSIKRYQTVIFNALKQELEEEAGLVLRGLPEPLLMVPAWLYDQERGIIDLAFVLPISQTYVSGTEKSRELLSSGDLRLINRSDLEQIQIVSERTRYMIEQALSVARQRQMG